MKEEHIKYKTALLARECGFILPISSENYYFNSKGIIHPQKWFIEYELEDCVDAVSQSCLQKWLRENHNIHIEECSEHWADLHVTYHFKFWFVKDELFEWSYVNKKDVFLKYEDALEDALYRALKYIV